MRKIILTVEDIGPLEKALDRYISMGSGLVWYKGVGWDWRMAKYALEDLKEQNAKKEGYF